MNKKLLFVNSRFLPLVGGGETYTLELMKHFSSQGWDVHLVTSERGFHNPTWDNSTIHYLDGFDDNELQILSCAPALRKILREVQPDLIHVHNLLPYFTLSSITGSDEFPLVLSIHNTPLLPIRVFGGFKDFESECVFTRQLLLNGKYKKLFFGSRYYLDSYAEIAPWIKNDGKSEVAYFFPPTLTTGPLKAKELTNLERRVNLLFPSRILHRKGVEECIMALARLPERFVLSLPAFASCEDELYQASITKLIDELGITERVLLPDQVTTPEHMIQYYREADIVVIPSHYEGFGIVAVEAMSWGVPVIATNIGGLGEIVRDGVNGLLVAPKSVTDIEKAVLKIAADKTLVRSLVDGGIATVNERFNRHKHMEQIESVYKQLLSDSTNKQKGLLYESKAMANARA